jgi:hypothetical protein
MPKPYNGVEKQSSCLECIFKDKELLTVGVDCQLLTVNYELSIYFYASLSI